MVEGQRGKVLKSQRCRGIFSLLVFCLLLFSGPALSCENALSPLEKGELPLLPDDMELKNLEEAVSRSIASFRSIDDDRQYDLCGSTYSAKRLRLSLEAFRDGIDEYHNAAEFQRFIFDTFTVCRAAGGDGDGSMLVTAYYEPVFSGSLEKKAPYLHPLYQLPDNLVVIGDNNGGKRVGRMENDVFLPYWTRGEIEDGNLLSGKELVYLADPIEAFLIHVQGSARVKIDDGSFLKIQYAGNNGHAYRSIGKVLVERHIMSLEEVTMPAITNYLHEHPEKIREILQQNDRFIFFNGAESRSDGPDDGPVGSLGQFLTAGRSLALDRSCFPAPMIGFMLTDRPEFDDEGGLAGWKSLHRFVVNQDSGAAIKGAGRVDLFLGRDEYASRAAGLMKQPGELYFLLLKN